MQILTANQPNSKRSTPSGEPMPSYYRQIYTAPAPAALLKLLTKELA